MGKRTGRVVALAGLFALVLGHVASDVLEELTGRPRPLASVLDARLPVFAAISYSRVYVGVHYPTDVLAGAGLGIAYGWVGAPVLGESREPSGEIWPSGQDRQSSRLGPGSTIPVGKVTRSR